MATTTRNLGLTKPAGGDPADINVLNANFDVLDNVSLNEEHVPYELAGTTAAHNGRKRAVHGIPDTQRLIQAHQLGYDPYSRVVPFPRWANTTQTVTDSTLFVTYVIPTVDLNATKFFVETYGTAAVGATLVQMALFEVNADKSLTSRVTSADVHASVLTGATNFYQPAFNSVGVYTLYAGVTYGVALLAVGQTTPAVVRGANVGVATFAPTLCNTVASQTTMPSTVATGSLVASSSALWLGVSE